ncbi:MAG: hypothetical protein CM15mP21_0810 [Hyphomicrobiales bacterium]|nr:MAG: hypothetical protein CM15mP21_0810 [Hyphomicrobiales bacterium]
MAGYLEHISLVMDAQTQENDDKVSLMTLHAAKGLEFDTVFLPGWGGRSFPASTQFGRKRHKRAGRGTPPCLCRPDAGAPAPPSHLPATAAPVSGIRPFPHGLSTNCLPSMSRSGIANRSAMALPARAGLPMILPPRLITARAGSARRPIAIVLTQAIRQQYSRAPKRLSPICPTAPISAASAYSTRNSATDASKPLKAIS